MRTRGRGTGLVAAMGFTLVLFGSCLNGKSVAPEVSERGSPAALFELFARTHSDPERDIEGHALCLHPYFLFEILGSDRHADPSLPPDWNREEETSLVARMFEEASSIHMELAVPEEYVSIGCDPANPEGEPYCRIYEVEADITVVAAGEAGPDTLRVSGLAYTYVTEDPDDPDQWVIFSVHDRTDIHEPGRSSPRGEGEELITWGVLLGRFRS